MQQQSGVLVVYPVQNQPIRVFWPAQGIQNWDQRPSGSKMALAFFMYISISNRYLPMLS
jgi:hypothetical protein